MQRDGMERRTSLRRETGSYVPRQYNAATRARFLRKRRQIHLARVTGPPSTAQVTMALTLARLEWGALKAEHEDTLQGDREGREHRRLLVKLLADFEKSLVRPEKPEKPPGVDAVLAEMTR
jgi:hypothetical protein